MQRNASKCAHCGKAFYRLTRETAVINRSDETSFHISLFSGPDPRPNVSGGFYPNQVTCNFTYAHDRIGATYEHVVVVILSAGKNEKETLRKIEEAADKLAGLISEGKKLEAVYTLDDGEIMPGFPR